MAVDFTIKADDQLPEFQNVLKDDLNAIVNLTGVLGVRFIMKDKATNEVKIDAPAVIVTPLAGLVKYVWEVGDTDTIGTYNAEFEVQFGDGRLETFPNWKHLQVKVFGDLGGIQ